MKSSFRSKVFVFLLALGPIHAFVLNVRNPLQSYRPYPTPTSSFAVSALIKVSVRRGFSFGPSVLPRVRKPCLATSMKFFFSSANENENECSEELESKTFFPEADRIIAIGDVHGDVSSLRSCLQIAGLIDSNDRWTGGGTHLVQLGDILDRGDTEKGCIDLLFSLQADARAAGGNVHVLLGNHELMNVDHDFRYVTRGAWDGWRCARSDGGGKRQRLVDAISMVRYPPHQRERAAAFRPGGFMARRLARMPVAIRIGDALFVHAGVRLSHVKYGLEKLNAETAAWLAGRGARPVVLDADDSPVWIRQYSVPDVRDATERELENVLRALDAQRMVVGHTPQLRGINCFTTERGLEVWRCDTGMSSGMMAGPIECLELLPDGRTHVLTQQVPAHSLT